MHGRLEPGSTFAGEYRVIRAIGAGGMGAVYEVEQVSTRKRRALKVLGNRFGRDEKARARFIREATVGASIDSEHVVDVIGAGVDDTTGLPWLAMELLDGLDLKRLLDHRGALKPGHMRAVFRQLGHGLAAAHESGVIHRDLKPENIFVARSRRAGSTFTIKILDFGIAKIARESVITTDTATIGSPMWMAPEQINADPLSARTDVWALGLLAFWTLTRRVYWTAAYGARVTVQALFAEQLFAELAAPSVRAQEYGCGVTFPPEFDAWFSNCVARSPGARFADAGAAINALLTVIEDVANADPTPRHPLLPSPQEAAERRQSSPIPISSGPHRSEQMAGTTADVLAAEQPHATAPSEAAIGLQSTNLDGALQNHPTQHPPAPVAPPQPRAAKPGSAKVAAFVAIPVAAVLGAGVAVGVTQWGGEEVARPVASKKVDAEHADPPTQEDEEPPPTGKVDTGTLPAPVELAFLGWTADGERFAVRASYGSKLPRGDQKANFLELIHVARGRTGKIDASYAVDRVASAEVDDEDPLAVASRTAHPSELWVERRVTLLLRPPEARRSPRRPGELRMQLLEVPTDSRVRISPKLGGFDLRWWGFETESPGAAAPRMELSWHHGGKSKSVLDERYAVAHPQLARIEADGEVSFRHEVRVFWSPNETFCVVVLDGTAEPETPGLADRRWFLREVAK